jgi:hypothetical protein
VRPHPSCLPRVKSNCDGYEYLRYGTEQHADYMPLRTSGDILRAVNGAASLHRGTPASCGSVSGLPLPRSTGRVSTLARERPVALARGLPSATESSPRGFSTWLSPWRSCLAAHPPARFTPSRGNPSPGLPAHRRHGWNAARLPPRADGESQRNPCMSRYHGR